LVSGPDFLPNTYVIGTSSGTSTITLSKPAITRGATGTVSVTLSNNAGTLTTSNTGGLDGTITSPLTRTFGTGTNYIFNAATSAPFSTSSNNIFGNVTFNAPATTNKNQFIGGILNIASGKLTIRSTDTLTLTSSNDIAGGPFSSSKYIVTDNASGSVGVLRMYAFSTSKLFPIGSATNYLPVTLTPTSSDSLAVSVFEGATLDGTPNGTAMSLDQKGNIVNAIWTINRTSSNTNACSISTSWASGLEGSVFASLANNQIGLSRYSGSDWTAAIGSGDNVANTATNSTFTSFGAFGVGKVGTTLPVKISSFNAIQEQGKIKLTWKVSSEINVSNYTIEKSTDGIHFNTLSTVNANNIHNYTSYDFAPASINYYRIKVLDNNNSISYSSIVKIKTSSTKAELVVYPNPVVNNQFSIQLSNLAKGKTDVVIYNNIGQQVFSKSILSEEGSQTQYISLPTSISKGLYKLVITNNETKLQQTLLMQ
jgi:hypothetical protein